MNPLLAQFIAESRDQLELTGAGLLAIENNPHDTDKLNEIFRAAHTIKGSSGLFEMRPVTLLVHAAEDLLDALRSQTVTFERGMVDLLLDAFDQVSQWLDLLEQTETLPVELEATARELGAKLRVFLKDIAPEAATDAPSTPAFDELNWIGQFPEEERAALHRRLTESGEPLLAFRYAPDAQCFFQGEDPFYQVRQIPGLALLDFAPTEPWLPLTELDAYCCVLRFEGLACAPHADVATLFRYVPDQVCLLAVPPQVLAVPVGRRDDDPAHYDGFVVEALELVGQEDWAGLRSLIALLLDATDPGDWTASALRWLRRLVKDATPDQAAVRLLLEAIRTEQGPDWLSSLVMDTPPIIATKPQALSDVEQAAFQHIAAEQLRILELPVEPESWSGRIRSVCACLANGLRYARRVDWLEELEEAREIALDTGATATLRGILARLMDNPPPATEEISAVVVKPEELVADKLAIKTLKVDQHKVDRLMDLIGELVVAKNGLPYLAQRAERVYGQRDLAREIKDQYGVINRIAQELQSSIMQIRMMPVGHVFQRFPRLVRDLSKKLDKKINLVVEGEDTEADKNIIETLADPLIHILRNSIDHGIESPEERLSLGKSDEGWIRVKAYQDNDNVAIEISDDGRGVDAAAVKDKAVRRGLITPEQAETISDHEAVQWIFAPGLSTADQVSDISGRGVGMDVVRNSVDKVGGAVTVHSRQGMGTDIRLTLPLSMAVTQVMAVELDGKLLGVPMDIVVETVRLPPAAIYAIKQREAFILRDRLVPLTRLRRLLDLSEPATGDAALATLVVKFHGESVGIVVDNFREGMEVILKPLEGVLAGLRHYAGTALLGDGSVMLVINLKELL
ncbi:chemotaxis protein CheA [Candidatus Contendibacter odensensis]|uniref:Chemotaxis protein CheA n=1 Tax=Candidatus Contendobacter odensis Run_B_J11 TaxID=1400861 RepID=A0A7U7J5W2_9GAMM|nr:chemotaxis protein CheA [Candidatus Contendobacter odensis]CDH46877.1 putative CheA signal transduction histidine kinase [Candidatus Contendobacter odensis Run_B_J11]